MTGAYPIGGVMYLNYYITRAHQPFLLKVSDCTAESTISVYDDGAL